MKPFDLAPPLALLFLLLSSCGTEPAPPANPGTAPPASSHQATSVETCADRASIQAHFQRACAVTGTYTIKTFHGKKGDVLDDWPVLVLADGSEVMIESIWDRDKKPDPATLQGLQGKRVEATGTLHASPPREQPANFGFPCLSPVHSLRVVPD